MSNAFSPWPVMRIAAFTLCGCALCRPTVADDREAASLTLEAVNQTLNHRILYAEIPDRWATPDELFARGSGDCKDFAVAKYFALVAAGVPAQQLRLVYVRVLLGGDGDIWRSHMVLAYLPSLAAAGDERILDSMLDDIRPLSRRPDLQVLISFNADGVWAGLDRGPAARAASQIVPWAQVLERVALPH